MNLINLIMQRIKHVRTLKQFKYIYIQLKNTTTEDKLYKIHVIFLKVKRLAHRYS